jgi:hypothetical protein
MNFSAFNSASFNASGGIPLVLAYASLAGSCSTVTAGTRTLFADITATATADITSTALRTVFSSALIDSSQSEIVATATRILEPTSTVASSVEITSYAVLMRLGTANIFSDMSLSVGSIANPTVLDPAWRVFTRIASITEFDRSEDFDTVFIRPADAVFRRVA